MRTLDPRNENSAHHRVMRLLARLQCADCGTRFKPQDFAVLHQAQDNWVLNTNCGHCGKPSVVIVAIVGDAEPEPHSDLGPEEVRAAKEWPPLTTDDVLDMHLLLQKLDEQLPF